MEFNYVVISPKGERITGKKNAEKKEDVFNFLITKGFTVISLSETLNLDLSNFISTDIGGIPLKEKVILIKQLSTMISAGIPIIQAIDLLVKQAEKPALQKKLSEIYKAVESGSSLTEAFSRQTGILSEVQINLLAAGEKSGNLSEILSKITIDMEKSKVLRGQIIGALIYPAVIFVAMIAVIIVLILFMVPQVKDLYASFGRSDLPFATQILIGISDLFSNSFSLFVIIIGIITMFVAFRYANTTYRGRRFIDKFKLRVPILGNLIKKMEITQFCRIFSMLLTSGIPITEATEITGKALSNKVFSDILVGVKDDIIKGSNLSLSLAKHNTNNAYPVILVKIIAVGEESGKLEKVMEDIGSFYEAEVTQMSTNLTKLIEPFIMLIAGGLVMFLALAIYTPTLQIVQNIS